MHYSLGPVVILLLVAVISVFICRRLNIPAMMGYLIVGFIAGPGVLHLVPQTPETDFVGEIGIVFLMFTIGLEFSLAKLKAMKRMVLGLGGLQVGLTMTVLILVSMLANIPFLTAFAVAGALTMSSTAIASRLLSERVELGQQHGKMTMSVLLMQDIAVVPIMILLPALATHSSTMWMDLLMALGKMVLVLTLLFVVGKRLVSPWFHVIARIRSSELFMVNVLLITLGVAYLTDLAGLSLALGAFVAGMLISETDYRYQVEEDIRPFRDMLLGFFFITVGMKLNIQALLANIDLVLILLAMAVIAKAVIVFAAAKAFKYKTKDSLTTALYLAQGGEFGFVLLAISGQLKLLTPESEQAAIAAILISMLIAPFLIAASSKIVNKLVKSNWDTQAVDLQNILVENMSKTDHVLMLGYGRTGQAVARLLEQENIPYYALDLDVDRVQAARSAGEAVSFGDAKRKDILIAAGIQRAKAAVVTMHHTVEAEHILAAIMSVNPTLPVVVRSTDETHMDELLQHGAEAVVSDTMEVSLVLASQTLMNMGLPFERIFDTMKEVRSERYALLQGFFKGSTDEPDTLESNARQNRLQSMAISEESYAANRTLAELNFAQFRTQLRLIRRGTHKIKNPAPEFVLLPGDILVMIGVPSNLINTENFILQGPE
ncbi:MAG: cation:proton antiporter domain-containing protein [Neisseriaceae bacterium]